MDYNINMLKDIANSNHLPEYIINETKQLLIYEVALADWYCRKLDLITICYYNREHLDLLVLPSNCSTVSYIISIISNKGAS